MSAGCCKFYTVRHQNSQTVAPKAGKMISHRIAGLFKKIQKSSKPNLDTQKNYKISA